MLRFEIRKTGTLPDPAALTEQVRVAANQIVELWFRRAFMNLSGRVVRSRSGKTARGLRARVAVQGSAVVGGVGTDWFVGHILETGARAHPIDALRVERLAGFGRRATSRRRAAGKIKAHALAFQWGGRTVIYRRVKHPGIRPFPWATRALQESEQEAAVIFEREVKRVLETRDRKLAEVRRVG